MGFNLKNNLQNSIFEIFNKCMDNEIEIEKTNKQKIQQPTTTRQPRHVLATPT